MSKSKRRSTKTRAQLTAPNKPGILFVEDDPDHAKVVLEHLRTYSDYEVYHAKTVQQALNIAKKYPTLRFVAMDMGLPKDATPGSYSDLSGIILMREFGQLLPRAKIYIKSGLGFKQETKKFIEAYGKSVVRVGGPWDPDEIIDKARIVYSQGRMRPSIFIVHGHDKDALKQLISLVKNELRLGEPTVIKDKPQKGRVIIEKFEEYAQRADLVFALLTPDDATKTGRRARQNVIFEIGYFSAALGRNPES